MTTLEAIEEVPLGGNCTLDRLCVFSRASPVLIFVSVNPVELSHSRRQNNVVDLNAPMITEDSACRKEEAVPTATSVSDEGTSSASGTADSSPRVRMTARNLTDDSKCGGYRCSLPTCRQQNTLPNTNP